MKLIPEEARSFVEAAEAAADTFLDEVVSLAPQLRAYALLLTRSSDQAEDLLQDTMLKAVRFRGRFEPGTNLRAWLYTIVRNTHLSAKRRDQRLVQDVEGQLAGQLAEPPAQEWRIRHSELLAALDRLPAEARSLLLLIGAGTTYEAAAEICGCPVGTVRSRVHRARHRLQLELDSLAGAERGAATRGVPVRRGSSQWSQQN